MGALLDAVSLALRNFNNVNLPELPRMADMAHWVSCAEPAWKAPPGSFIEAYKKNQSNAHALTLEIYRITGEFPRSERYGLTSQLRRSVSSVPSNIAEGCGRGTDADLSCVQDHKLRHRKGRQSKSWVRPGEYRRALQ